MVLSMTVLLGNRAFLTLMGKPGISLTRQEHFMKICKIPCCRHAQNPALYKHEGSDQPWSVAWHAKGMGASFLFLPSDC